MHILDLRALRGPNRHERWPMILLRLDIGVLEDHPSNEIPGFVGALLAALPGLRTHGCSYGEEGGFVRRLEEGTWFGHIVEHVAIELQSLVGYPEVTRGKTRGSGQRGVYDVVFAYEDEDVGLDAARVALAFVTQLLPDDLRAGCQAITPVSLDLPPDAGGAFVPTIEDYLRGLHAYAKRRHLGPSTRSLVEAAKKRYIPVRKLIDPRGSLFQLGWGSAQRRIEATITGFSPYLAVELAQDKQRTARLLGACGLPVPRQARVRSAEEAMQAASSIGYPVVVKPADLSKGRGISLDLRTPAAVADAWNAASALSSEVLVETFFPGRDYRVLVVDGNVVAVAERVPAHVIGDGKHTIAELVDIVNQDPRRGDGHENVLTKLVLDDRAIAHLGRQGLLPNDVPEDGRTCYLCGTANLSTGGVSIDRTDSIHAENRLVAVRAARQVGLDVAGIDLVCPDISQPISEVGGGIVEVNAAPGFRMHVAPAEGQPRDVGGAVIDYLFPSGDGRVPIVSITGTNGKTTTTKMVAHILGRATGKIVGHTCSEGIYLGHQRIATGDCSGPNSARILLSDAAVDAVVLETARGGLLREGLAFDVCDVGCVLNVSADHLGLNGIDTIEQLAEVKRVVVESVRSRGTSVLNADDPLCRAMAPHAGGTVTWFSLEGSDFAYQRLAAGDRVAILEEGHLAVWEGGKATHVARASDIPATVGGTARFNIANALAATAIATALGVPPDRIREALEEFSSSLDQNPGRLNIIGEGLPYRVIVDYAHNVAALQAICEFVDHQPRRRVIGVLMSAGDRRDEDIRTLGRVAAEHMDVLIAKEDNGRRGRKEGEISDLMLAGAREAGMDGAVLHAAMSDDEAVDLAFDLAEAGDIVLLCLEDTEHLLDRIAAEVQLWADRAARRRTIDAPNAPAEPGRSAADLATPRGKR